MPLYLYLVYILHLAYWLTQLRKGIIIFLGLQTQIYLG